MRYFILLTILLSACCTAKKNKSEKAAKVADSTVSPAPEAPKNSTATPQAAAQPKPEKETVSTDVKIPACVQSMIDGFKKEDVQNPPRKVFSYTYHGGTVYYVPAVCCDNFSDLYDAGCKLMGHPDGGFTGRGDGKITDFKETATNKRLLWADTRKP